MKNQNGFFYRNVMVLDKNFPSHVTTTKYIGAVALNLGFHFVDKILAERQDGFFIDFFIGIWKHGNTKYGKFYKDFLRRF